MSLDKQKFQNADLHEDKLRIFMEHFPETIITNKDDDGNKTYEIDANKLNSFFNGGESVLIHTPEKPRDGYELSWVGKKFAYQDAFQKGDKILKTEKYLSKNFDKTENVVLIGDNIHALKLLRENYHNSIKCIYIDPPYNTGSDGFIYKDKFSESDETICEILGYDEGYKDFIKNIASSKTHSAWMSFMLSRLLLAKELLTDDGVIFISIDDNEQANLKIVCDEIFGESNFIANFIWKGRGGRQDSSHIAEIHEYILCYAKKIDEVEIGRQIQEFSEKNFPYYDEKKNLRYKTQLARKWGSNSLRIDRPNLYYPIMSPDNTEIYPLNGSNDGCWRWGQQRMQQEINNDNLIFEKKDHNWVAYEKIYFDPEYKYTKVYNSMIEKTGSGANELKKFFNNEKLFEYPKPTKLIKLLVNMADITDGDIILDFFVGSGTTGDAVMQLNAEDGENRRFILVQLDEKIDSKDKKSKIAYDFCKDNSFDPAISSITIERLNRAGEKIIAETPLLKDGLDIGYRVFSIQDDLEHKLLNIPISNLQQGYFSNFESMKKDSELYSRENLLYNAFIYNNIPLSAKVKVLKENILYSVDDKFFCFGELSRDELANALENYPNAYFTLFADDEYASDSFIHTCKAHLEQISSNITFKVHG